MARQKKTGALADLSAEAGTEPSMLFGDRLWAHGLQRYACSGGSEPYVLGLHSFGGSLAFLCPRSGFSVAILLNDCQLDYSATRRILDVITEDLRIGHLDFLGDGFF